MNKIQHGLFRVGVTIKGLHALVELFGAILVYSTSGSTLSSLVRSMTAHELSEDPNDVLANFVLQNTSRISAASKDFAALYLFISAITNSILVIGLLANKWRLFPLAILVTLTFVSYQWYLYMHTHSLWLLLFIAYDTYITWLIYGEYKRQLSNAK